MSLTREKQYNTVILIARVGYTGLGDNPLRGGVKLAHKGA
jgi:hypothetical protein